MRFNRSIWAKTGRSSVARSTTVVRSGFKRARVMSGSTACRSTTTTPFTCRRGMAHRSRYMVVTSNGVSTTAPFFQSNIADGSTGKTITVRDVWFINTGGPMTVPLAQATDAGAYITLERCTYHNLSAGAGYTAGTSYVSGQKRQCADEPPLVSLQVRLAVRGLRRLRRWLDPRRQGPRPLPRIRMRPGIQSRDGMCKFTLVAKWTAATGTGNMKFGVGDWDAA